MMKLSSGSGPRVDAGAELIDHDLAHHFGERMPGLPPRGCVVPLRVLAVVFVLDATGRAAREWCGFYVPEIRRVTEHVAL